MKKLGNQPAVDVVVYAHNHEGFVEKSIRSIFEQRVEFPVRIRVHDDASDDSTARILRDLSRQSPFPMEVFRAPENRYQFGSRFKHKFLVDSSFKYLAILDADDFWTDPAKLNRQVQLLENDASVALCHHAYQVRRGDQIVETVRDQKPNPSPGLRFAQGNFVGTSSVMLRRESVPSTLPDGFDSVRGVDDWPIWALSTQNAHVGYIDSTMSVYRVHEHNNFANQELNVKRLQILRALVYIANSVQERDQPIWLRALERRVKKRKTILGSLAEWKSALIAKKH